MAQTITITSGLTLKDSSSVSLESIPQKSKDVSITSGLVAGNTQSIGTTYEALALGDVASNGGPGYFENLDSTNYVEIGLEVSAAFVPFIKLVAGQRVAIPSLANRAIYAKANTAAIQLRYRIWEP